METAGVCASLPQQAAQAGSGRRERRLLVLLTDSLATLHRKGEIKPRYYNPGNFFSEVHCISPCRREIAPSAVRAVAGDARLVLHPLGPSYSVAGFLPMGRVASTIRTIRPDVIRAYDPGLRGALAVFWGKRLGVPSVISVHNDLDDQRRHERRLAHRLRRLFEAYALPRADRVICVSRYVSAYARRYGAARVDVIYNRVSLDQFADAATGESDRHDDGEELHVLSVGRLVRQKFQECLIRAIRPLRLRLTLIGDGPLRGALDRLVDQLGLRDRVRFIPAVPHGEIAAYYRQADLFAIATHYEGFCIPVLEAMASGLPVVASRIGPIEELVGNAGVLVENTPEAFTQALARLIRDPSLRLELGRKARARMQHLDGARIEVQEQALYQSLCGVTA